MLAAISCRKPHRESTVGDYVPPLNDEGQVVQRQGFMVGCKTDLDCYNRCGSAVPFKPTQILLATHA
jgi:hypothetical protein